MFPMVCHTKFVEEDQSRSPYLDVLAHDALASAERMAEMGPQRDLGEAGLDLGAERDQCDAAAAAADAGGTASVPAWRSALAAELRAGACEAAIFAEAVQTDRVAASTENAGEVDQVLDLAVADTTPALVVVGVEQQEHLELRAPCHVHRLEYHSCATGSAPRAGCKHYLPVVVESPIEKAGNPPCTSAFRCLSLVDTLPLPPN